MSGKHDLKIILESRYPIIAVQAAEETRVINLIKSILDLNKQPLFVWSVTEGLNRVTTDSAPQPFNSEPSAVLQHIKAVPLSAVYILCDFHPYLDNAFNIRLLKEIALEYEKSKKTIVLLGNEVKEVSDLRHFTARYDLTVPNADEVKRIVSTVANEWSAQHNGQKVKTNKEAFQLLIRALVGLTTTDVTRLARGAIFDDGAITESDLIQVTKAKYELLNKNGVLHFAHDTASFADIAGLERLKDWLNQRELVFNDLNNKYKIDPPKGILLLGVQGCGKSLAAKAVSGVWKIPLLRFDFGAIYNKFIGESERILRESLKTAEMMEPCVLWLDELEKGLSSNDQDGGTSRRILGMLLTWMSEKKNKVFLVATANDIDTLPAELVRKGRFDEIFFVDLPEADSRKEIFRIHLAKRNLAIDSFDLDFLSDISQGFSGSEIEQAVVSSVYSALAKNEPVTTTLLENEIKLTKPLSIVMSEKVAGLRTWAQSRTVKA